MNFQDKIDIRIKKKTGVLEKTRQKQILKFLNAIPNCIAESRTQTGYGKKGGADIFGCFNGRHFELEVKQPGAQPTKLQKEWLDRWAANGSISGKVVDIQTTREVFWAHGVEI